MDSTKFSESESAKPGAAAGETETTQTPADSYSKLFAAF
jgi:hypothetical protein